MVLSLGDNLQYVKGVGEARIKLYGKLGLSTVEDLIFHLPRSYLDLRSPRTPETAVPGELCAVQALVASIGIEHRLRKGLSVWKVRAVGAAAVLDLTFYNAKFTVGALREGQEYLFYGRVGGQSTLPGGKREMPSPVVYPLSSIGLIPVYPATAGLTSRMISVNVTTALAALPELVETLPPALVDGNHLLSLDMALRELHRPTSPQTLEEARRRLVFEELLCLALGLSLMRSGRQTVTVTPMGPVEMEPFYSSLPYTPTAGQQSAIRDCMTDMQSGQPMNRLVQGDVGCGKTLVAAAACYFAHRNGRCSAMMAPTELLAEQHCRTLTALLGPLGLRVALLTGSMSAKEKRLFKTALAVGEIDVAVGTHALLTADTIWENLGLVITDEQHRFGVSQRMSLTQKGREVHTLIMSATPIPRTLGLIVYGDMELSVIRELPLGRQPIETFLIDSGKRHRAFGYIKKHLDRGLQGYIVCPLVEEDEELPDPEKKAAVDYLGELTAGEFAGYRLGLLHGRMKPKDKEAVMGQFAAGQLDLLVSTTVIEVGIDVANAVIILIENAESFGLSQLHQLRGRVGRGTEQSTCILVSDSKAPETQDRLRTLCNTTDGFRLAEYDLSTRGPGDFFGLRQHGVPQLRVASLTDDLAVLEETRTAAEELLAQDPLLATLPRLGVRVRKMMEAAAVL